MHSSDVRQWIASYERARLGREQAKAQQELDRLALITREHDEDAAGSPLHGGWSRETSLTGIEDWPVPRPIDAMTRLALLLGVAIIASLAVLFG